MAGCVLSVSISAVTDANNIYQMFNQRISENEQIIISVISLKRKQSSHFSFFICIMIIRKMENISPIIIIKKTNIINTKLL